MKPTFLSIVCTFIVIFISMNLNAQSRNVSISGSVKDKADKAILPFVQVVLKTVNSNLKPTNVIFL